ncbi:hypothetical protein OC834_003351 [Tilletia horrida]|nr:hypothetical protein OC834_003351 [Tilletia horrida]KAK0531013.1 hypothetical protein OC835_003812 [Tilletia horrida]
MYGSANPAHTRDQHQQHPYASSSSASSSSTTNSYLAAQQQQQYRFRASPTGGMSGAASTEAAGAAGGTHAQSQQQQQQQHQQNASYMAANAGNTGGGSAGDRTDTVGRGTVLDPYGLEFNGGGAGAGAGLPMPATAASQSGWGASFARPARSHYFLSRSEIVKGVANRFVHSTAYLYFYGGMAAASLLTVFLSLLQDCPGTLFYSLELAINLLLIAEVGIRLFAFGKQFWKSTFNIIDLCLVVFCALTLLVIFFSHECSPYRGGGTGVGGRYGSISDGDPSYDDNDGAHHRQGGGGRGGKSEELLDSILLIIRNAMQCFRLVSVVRRSRQNVNSRVANIDLASAAAARGNDSDLYGYDYGASGQGGPAGGHSDADQPYGTMGGPGSGGRVGGIGAGAGGFNRAARFSLDIDLQDEGALARERMADGGDPAERRRRAERERWRTGLGGAGSGGAALGGGGGAGGGLGLGYKDSAPDEQRALFDADDDDDEEL